MVAQLRQEEGSGMRHRQVNETPNQPRRDPSEAEKSATAATIAVSDAIRRQLTTPGSVTPNQPRRDPSEAEKSAMAVSDAIRRQLTTPGSVTPDEQLRLLLADRAAHTGGA